METLEREHGYLFNIILLGDVGVGKSSILLQYKDGRFAFGIKSTVDIDFCIKTHEIDGSEVKLQVWDTPGSERFHAITRSYYRKADAAVLVYDIADAETFCHLTYWLEEIKKYAKNDVHCLLVGNKSDLRDVHDKKRRRSRKESGQKRKWMEESRKEERKGIMESETEKDMVTKESGKQFADKNGLSFMESTASDWDNINDLFVKLAKTLLDKKLTQQEKTNGTQDAATVDLVEGEKNETRRRRRCC